MRLAETLWEIRHEPSSDKTLPPYSHWLQRPTFCTLVLVAAADLQQLALERCAKVKEFQCKHRGVVDSAVHRRGGLDHAQAGAWRTGGGSPDSEPVLGWRPAVDQPVPGKGWVLEKKLGEGGFGEVWLGRDKRLKTEHVFKFCFWADRARSLKREVTLFRLLKERVGEHPNIVGIEHVYFDEAPFYIVMQHVEGEDLATWCETQGGVDKVPRASRIEVVAQVAHALQAAHDSGVILPRDV
jgi:hypothetical protein